MTVKLRKLKKNEKRYWIWSKEQKRKVSAIRVRKYALRGKYRRKKEILFKQKIGALKKHERELNRKLRYLREELPKFWKEMSGRWKERYGSCREK